jgi:hypothetical protein
MAIQRNLRHDTTYQIVSSWYSELENGTTCQNCERAISNCCEVQDAGGSLFTVGMDCAATLSGIKDSLLLSQTQASFQQAKSARAAILKFRKQNPGGEVSVKTYETEKNYYKQIGAGCWELTYRPAQGMPFRTWKQYPAGVWLGYVLPMIQGLAGQSEVTK